MFYVYIQLTQLELQQRVVDTFRYFLFYEVLTESLLSDGIIIDQLQAEEILVIKRYLEERELSIQEINDSQIKLQPNEENFESFVDAFGRYFSLTNSVTELIWQKRLIIKNLSQEIAETTKSALESAGAIVTIKQEDEIKPDTSSFIVRGGVFASDETPIANLMVRAYDRDLRQEQLLGEQTTQEDGSYEISYTRKQFRRADKQNADLKIKVFNQVSTQLEARHDRESIVFNAKTEETINVFLADGANINPSEYDRLLLLLNPILEGAQPASLSNEEIEFVVGETAIESLENEFPLGRNTIYLFKESDRLALATSIPIAAFYGWGRFVNQDWVMRDEARLKLDFNAILAADDSTLRKYLGGAISESWIPQLSETQLEAVLAGLAESRLAAGILKAETIAGILLAEGNEEPLSDYTVQARVISDSPQDLGSSTTDEQGKFSFTYIIRNLGDEVPLNLRLEIGDFTGEAIAEREVNISLPQEAPFSITAPVTPTPPKPIPGSDIQIESLNDSLGASLPPQLVNTLKDQNINNLADIRAAGGISQLQNLPLPADSPVLKNLEAQANLSTVSSDLQLNQKLIEGGYASFSAIAETPISRYLQKSKTLGIEPATSIGVYAQAKVSDSYVRSVIDNYRVDEGITYELNPALGNYFEGLLTNACKCTCNHALSPAAYLAELLDYITTHLDIRGEDKLTLQFLAQTFYQPFDQLPISCETSETPIKQVLICVEILRGYLSNNPPTNENQRQFLNSYKEYLFAAYQTILQQIGTSYEELRETRIDSKLKTSVARRLGVAEERLAVNELFIEADKISEEKLEQLFGLPQTTDPIFEENPKPQLIEWREAELRRQWQESDQKTELPLIDPDVIGIADVKLNTPAYRLFNSRQQALETDLNNARSNPQDLVGLNTLLQAYLNTSIEEIKQEDKKQKQGNQITEFVASKGLIRTSFIYLVSQIELLENGTQLLDSEWSEIYAIAIQAKKRREYFATWIEEEKQQNITLTPDLFNLTAINLLERLERDPALKWRIDLKRRREWQSTLETRLNQLDNLPTALNNAVIATKEKTLPSLRDALILASNAPGESLGEKAEWLTKRLLIDMRMDGCQTTTRISQATVSLQNLVFVIRTKQIDRDVARFSPLPKSFDRDWQWLGTYAAWKGATSVYLYPENLLLPSLLERKTPVFQEILRSLNKVNSFSSEDASAIYDEYLFYFSSVRFLQVKASCFVRNTMHLFGCSGYGNYYSTYDISQDNINIAHQFWEEIPKSRNLELLGATIHSKYSNPTYIVVFAISNRYHNRKDNFLKFIKYDLKNNSWDLEWKDLFEKYSYDPLGSFSVVQNSDYHPAALVIQGDDSDIFVKHLDDDANGWSAEDEQHFNLSFNNETINNSYRILSSFKERNFSVIISKIVDDNYDFLVAFENATSKLPLLRIVGTREGDRYIGAIQENDGLIKLFTRDNSNGLVYIYQMTWSSGVIGNTALRKDLFDVVPRSFEYQYQEKYFIGGYSGDNYANYALTSYDENTYSLVAYLNLYQLRKEIFSLANIDRENKYIRVAYYLAYNVINKKIPILPTSNLQYLDEAYYFLPLVIAQKFQQNNQYDLALDWYRTLYDYENNQPVFYFDGLEANTSEDNNLRRADDWFRDPLNPHAIAATRKGTYLRYTLFSIIGCLLQYADAEFTIDTAQSLAKARTLYNTALELLSTDELQPEKIDCDRLIVDVLNKINEAETREAVASVIYPLNDLGNKEEVVKAIAEIDTIIIGNNLPTSAKLEGIKAIVEENTRVQPELLTFNRAISESQANYFQLSQIFSASFEVASDSIKLPDYAYERYKDLFDVIIDSNSEEQFPIPDYLQPGYIPRSNFKFCIPPNPVLEALKLRAELNLYKIRSCRNIAGIKRQVDLYAVSTSADSGLASIQNGQLNVPGNNNLEPTQYRYQYIIARAKELVNIAQQVESSYLSAYQNFENENYTRLKANQDLELARAGVTLQDLRVQQAEGEVSLAELQKGRSQIQFNHYEDLIKEGWLWQETVGLLLQGSGVILGGIFGAIAGTPGGPQGTASASAIGVAVGSALSGGGAAFATYASYERREQEWKFQKKLARQDIRIGEQQIANAQNGVRVVGQERNISALQVENADATLEFLLNKKLNAELYAWMSNILRGVYSYFLQQATAVARMAEQQLAFERQESIAQYIQNDYWNVNDENAVSTNSDEDSDRLGLTGSARLLKDIYRLDQYYFETNERKLQLTKTVSLARLDPFAFQQFRETGEIKFNFPLELFDRDFPGHYLRLIRQVRTSIIALVPPNEGIKATLRTTGNSTVIISQPTFQSIPLKLAPQSVALTSPINATGLFELQQQPELLLPFEGLGVDTGWELSLPQASNPFNFDTIADVLITIDYTALHSEDYKSEIIQQLDYSVESDRAFSFRNEFADAWYDLNNPEQTDAPMRVTFQTRRQDFPPNIQDLEIANILLYFSLEEGSSLDGEEVQLYFTERNQAEKGGAANPIDSAIGTLKGNAASWIPIIGQPVEGEWRLSLPNTPEVKEIFEQEKIQDILLVITFSGEAPKHSSTL